MCECMSKFYLLRNSKEGEPERIRCLACSGGEPSIDASHGGDGGQCVLLEL